VRIVGGYEQGEDELSFVNQLGITGSWNPLTGTLLLTGAASPADYRTALRTVAFRNLGDDATGTRTVSFVVNDGIADSAAVTRGIVLTPQNDARSSPYPAHRRCARIRRSCSARHRQPISVADGRGPSPVQVDLLPPTAAEPAADHRPSGRRRWHRTA
jgi:hypothetical protein